MAVEQLQGRQDSLSEELERRDSSSSSASSSYGSDTDEKDDNERIQAIKELEKRIEENAKDIDAYLQLIKLYRINGDIEEARTTRLQLKQLMPLSPSIPLGVVHI